MVGQVEDELCLSKDPFNAVLNSGAVGSRPQNYLAKDPAKFRWTVNKRVYVTRFVTQASVGQEVERPSAVRGQHVKEGIAASQVAQFSLILT